MSDLSGNHIGGFPTRRLRVNNHDIFRNLDRLKNKNKKKNEIIWIKCMQQLHVVAFVPEEIVFFMRSIIETFHDSRCDGILTFFTPVDQ